jgi:hypothetical protein
MAEAASHNLKPAAFQKSNPSLIGQSPRFRLAHKHEHFFVALFVLHRSEPVIVY